MTRWKEDNRERVEFEDAHCIQERTEAIQVVIDDTCWWIPKTLVDDDSEVYKTGDIGTLIIPEWFALKEGMI